MPGGADGGAKLQGILRLRMTAFQALMEIVDDDQSLRVKKPRGEASCREVWQRNGGAVVGEDIGRIEGFSHGADSLADLEGIVARKKEHGHGGSPTVRRISP